MAPRQPLDAGAIGGTTEDEVLRSFVASVREWRYDDVAMPVFRRDDLVVLAEIVGTDATRIEQRLIDLTGCDRSTARRLRRLLLASLAVGIAFTAVANAPSGASAASAVASVVEARATSDASAIDPPPSAVNAVQAVGTDLAATPAPTTVPAPTAGPAPAPVPTPPSLPTPAPDEAPERELVPSGAEARISIERLGLDLPVFPGDQEVIDQGLVTHYWAPGWREPVAAGAVGTYWLAAHHETHGSPFGLVPGLVVGDRIDVETATQTFTYTVTSMEVVEDDAGFGPVYGADPDASLILLQTCLDHVRRLLVHGTLTAVA